MIPGIESLACGPLAVPPDVMAHVVNVESSRNPFAIGVVGGRLQRQPRSLAEAISTAAMLEKRGFNYSVGLAQVNQINFERFDLDTPESRFDPCKNLVTGAKILAECLQRHDGRWGDAFSCYYSGNARTGYEHGYVQKVFASMGQPIDEPAAEGAAAAIPLAGSAPSAEAGGWDTVFAARIAAPGASRREALASDTPLVPEIAALGDSALSTPAASTDAPGAAAGRGDRATEEWTDDSPEARFIAEVRRSDAGDAASAPNETITPRAGAPVEATPQPAESQQESKRQVSDAARVF